MTAAVLAHVEAQFDATIARLSQLVRIPSCSFAGFDPAHVDASAQDTAQWLREAGFPQVEILTLPGVLPYVLAEDRRAGPQAPTVLCYAHHDVQPPLRQDIWQSDPFTPTIRDGRLYARGAADDKAGIACIAAAHAAWIATHGQAPVNVIAFIEGEEESGSHHMAQFLATHGHRLQADGVVIADLANVDAGLPSLTTSLRGHVGIEIELRAQRSPLHSGMWGGAVRDPVAALCRLLATLTDADGNIAVPGLLTNAREPTPTQRADLARVPYDAERFRAQAGLLPHASAPTNGAELHERLWLRPSLAINAIQAGQRGQTGNVIMDAAWARLGVRIVPDQQATDVCAALETHLRANVPPGMELTITAASNGSPWATATAHPLFAAMRRALHTGYGVAPVEIGCGASIPFVQQLTDRLGGVPALLIGVEDPACAAHAENESVHLGDLRSAIRGLAAFYAEMAATSP